MVILLIKVLRKIKMGLIQNDDFFFASCSFSLINSKVVGGDNILNFVMNP